VGSIFEHELEIEGHRTYAVDLDGGGPPLLLLHGYSDSADTWRPAMDVLRRRGHRARAVDMPGFGRAQRLDRERPVLEQLDEFVAGALRTLAADSTEGSVVVVGNSLGGCQAIRAAQNADLPIGGIVPIAPAGLDLARWIRAIQTASPIQMLLRTPVPLPTWAIRAAVGQAYRTMAFARPRAVAGRSVAAFTSHVSTKRDVVRILGTGSRLYPEITSPFQLERVRCPTLVVWGERDAMVYSRGAQKLLDQVPGSRLELIPDCGHCPQIEARDRFVAVLLEFVSELAGHPAGRLLAT